MPANLVFLGIHFAIGKCKWSQFLKPEITHAVPTFSGYSNSLLASCVLCGPYLLRNLAEE